MTTGETYAVLSKKTVSAANGVENVYRDAGEGGVVSPIRPEMTAVAAD
jgi:hypothetical protein